MISAGWSRPVTPANLPRPSAEPLSRTTQDGPNGRPQSRGILTSPMRWRAIPCSFGDCSETTDELRLRGPRKAEHRQRHANAADDEERDIDRGRMRIGRGDRQHRKPDIEHEYLAHHAKHRKAVIGGALIEMRAMRRPERLAPRPTQQQ